MSAYWDCLTACQTALTALPYFLDVSIKIRPAPVYIAAEDTPPLVIVSPRPDMWESVKELTFSTHALIAYPVLVSAIVANAFTTTQLQWLIDARQAIREALYKPTLTGTGAFDVDYDPRPRGMDLAGLAQPMWASVQQFDFTVDELRAV